jgi:hypothetical protein
MNSLRAKTAVDESAVVLRNFACNLNNVQQLAQELSSGSGSITARRGAGGEAAIVFGSQQRMVSG